MKIKPNKNYFLVRVLKLTQEERKDKIGSIVIPPALVFYTRNMQCGEILGIGENVKKHFPEAKEGHILLFHHFVEATDDRRVHSDENYNYYVVSGYAWKDANKGEHHNETYAVYDGEKIITQKDFVLLEKELPPPPIPYEQLAKELAEKQKEGLYTFKDWKLSNEQIDAKIAEIRKEIKSLSMTRMTPERAIVIQGKERECELLGKEKTKKRYLPYKVAAANFEISKTFGLKNIVSEILYCLSIAAMTEIEFMNKEYIICKTDYVGFLYK